MLSLAVFLVSPPTSTFVCAAGNNTYKIKICIIAFVLAKNVNYQFPLITFSKRAQGA
jgi:hypothetical protein